MDALVRKYFARFGLVLLGVFLSLVICEVALRVAGYPSRVLEWDYDSSSGYGFGLIRPNQDYIERWYDHQPPHRVRINSMGFRDNELEYKDGLLIFTTGDSFAYGAGVEFEDAFVDLLEKELRKKYPLQKIEVVNGAGPGGTIDSQIVVFRVRGLPLKPKVLLIQFFENDISGLIHLDRLKRVIKPIGFPFKDVLRRTAIYIQLYRLKYLASWRTNMDAGNVGEGTEHGSFYLEELSPYWEEGWQLYFSRLKEIIFLCRREGIEVFILVIPSQEQVKDQGLFPTPQVRIKDFAKTFGVKVLDPLEDLRRLGGEKNYIPNDGHLNKQGHQIVASVIFRQMTRTNVFDSGGSLRVKAKG